MGDIADKVLECDNGYVIAKLVAYTDKEETASNKKTLKEQKQSSKTSRRNMTTGLRNLRRNGTTIKM